MLSVSYLIFTATVVFLTIFGLKLKKAKKKNASSETFWAREQEANFTRKVNPDTIEYLNVPVETFPFQENPDQELKEIQDTIRTLSKERLLNLTGLTNTDIKLTYGAANFPMISLCDQRFMLFSRTLCQWGAYLSEHGEPEKAKIVLEYALSCKTDISQVYTLLADIYLEEKQPEKVAGLILSAEELSTLMKPSIIKSLKEKLAAQ